MITSKQYRRAYDNKLCQLVNNLNVGDIFNVKSSHKNEYREDTYLVCDVKYSTYDENLDESWSEIVPIYTLKNLETDSDYEGIVPGGEGNIYTLLA